MTTLQKQFGPRFSNLSKQEVQALATAYIEGEVSNVRLQELLIDHPVEITRMLQGLCAQGFLVSDNRRRWTKYRLAQAGDSLHWPQESLHLEEDSSHLAGDSLHLEGMSEEQRILAAQIATKRKAPVSAVRDVIQRLCAGRYLTSDELAQLLKRNPDGLRNRYLTPMVAEGVLKLRYSETPNRPDQAYTASEVAK